MMSIILVCVPATLIGVIAGAIYASRMGKDLDQDPEEDRKVCLKSQLYDAGADNNSCFTSRRIWIGQALLNKTNKSKKWKARNCWQK
nr:anaerobic C4-dicarboxylate transporter family protein [Pelotomaculum propionicicum]